MVRIYYSDKNTPCFRECFFVSDIERLLQRRDIELGNLAGTNFYTRVSHIAGLDHKTLTSGQLSSQIIKIAAVQILTLRIHDI